MTKPDHHRPRHLKFLVLDEADELLHDLFYQHVRWILDNSNPSKQMIVTTATVPANVQFVIDRYMKYHEYIDLGVAVRRFNMFTKTLIFSYYQYGRTQKTC